MAKRGDSKKGDEPNPEYGGEVELPTGKVDFQLNAETREAIRGCLKRGNLQIDVNNARIGILRGRPVLAAWAWD